MFVLKILHKVLAREQAFLFLLILGSILSLALIVRLLSFSERLMSQNLSVWDTGVLLFYLTPFFLFLLIPLGCMLSVFLTFLRMNTDRELIALRAGGVSIYQMLPTTILLCLLCTGVNYGVSIHGLGWGMQNFYNAVFDLAMEKSEVSIQPGTFNSNMPGLTIYTQKIDSRTREMHNVFIRDKTNREVDATVVAATGEMQKDPENFQLLFVLRNGSIYRNDSGEMSVLGFDRYVIRFDMGQLLDIKQRTVHKESEMTWAQLQAESAREDLDAEDEREVRMEKSKRIVLPLSSIILGLLAMPMAFAFQGLNKQYGIILVLFTFFGYFTIFSVGLSLGNAGVIGPITGLWLPNGLLLALGVLGIRLCARERSPRILTRMQHFLQSRKKGTDT